MRRDTFLDFLTQRSSPKATQEFERVFADLSDSEKKELVSDILQTARDVKGVPTLKLPNWLKKLTDNKSNEGKAIEKILDMSPSDLDNLFKVMKSPSNDELMKQLDPHSQQLLKEAGVAKDREITIDTTLSPGMLKEPLTPEKIEKKISQFKLNSKNSSLEAEFSKETYDFKFKGTEAEFEELGKQLKIKPTYLESIKERKRFDFDTFKQRVFLKTTGNEAHLMKPQSPKWVKDQANQFKNKYKDVVKIANFTIETDVDGGVLEYQGPKEFFEKLLRTIGVTEEYITTIEKQSAENFGLWKIRFTPSATEEGSEEGRPYLTAWMEEMTEGSPEYRSRWENMLSAMKNLSSKSPNIKIEPEGQTSLLNFRGSLAQLRDVFQSILPDPKLVKPMIDEVEKNKKSFKVKDI